MPFVSKWKLHREQNNFSCRSKFTCLLTEEEEEEKEEEEEEEEESDSSSSFGDGDFTKGSSSTVASLHSGPAQ